MSLNPSRLREVLDGYFGSQPHPKIPSLTRADYDTFASVTALIHGVSHPNPQAVDNVAKQLKSIGIPVAEFERLWRLAKPLSQRLLNRVPTIPEIAYLRDHAHPADVTRYYHEHPHPQHPDIPAGEFARVYTAAKTIAQNMVRRNPVGTEIAMFVHGGYDANDIHAHYEGHQAGRQR